VLPRFSVAIVVLAAVGSLAAQVPADTDVKPHIDNLSAFDYSTRMNAARMLRRTDPAFAVPALVNAVRSHTDEFVRYRALVVLTSFNDRGTPTLMRALLSDRNDRVREIVYRWFERNPDPALTASLLGALNTEQSEFVRPALVRAIAALPVNAVVEKALVGEIGRGFDFFRSAVIDALGEHRAAYAVDAIAAVAAVDGPLQDDAVLALGRIGDRRALATLAAITTPSAALTPVLQATQCMLGSMCEARVEWLITAAGSVAARPEAVRGAIAALGALAQQDAAARAALMKLAQRAPERLRSEIALALSGVALRQPDAVIAWLASAADDERTRAVDLLREGFESLEEDFAEEQFFAAARAGYWNAADGSAARTIAAALIDKLEF
jgi:HEAT repeat protein